MHWWSSRAGLSASDSLLGSFIGSPPSESHHALDQPAVHLQRGTGDVTRCIRQQKSAGPAELLGDAVAAERDGRERLQLGLFRRDSLSGCGNLIELAHAIRVHAARDDLVDADL